MKFMPSTPLEPPKPVYNIILASQSIGRRYLMDKLCVPFRVVPTNLEEDKIVDNDPKTLIKKRARAKALEIVENARVYSLSQEIDSIVIAADSMAVLGKKVYGKPETRESAKDMLAEIMDKTHTFVTATTIIHYGKKNPEDVKLEELKRWEDVTETKVTLRKLSKAELDSYVARYDLSRFAAAYALNDIPWDIVTKIDGSYTNVIGLPLDVVLPIFRKLQIIL